MASSKHVDQASDNPGEVSVADASPVAIVERFLDLFVATEDDEAVDLLTVDVLYENTGLPAVRGREQVRRIFRAARRLGGRFEYRMHAISVDGESVLTERTDALEWGRMRVQFWVCGRFDVRDGEIVLWRDRFDYLTFSVAFLRGLLGIVVPAARPRLFGAKRS